MHIPFHKCTAMSETEMVLVTEASCIELPPGAKMPSHITVEDRHGKEMVFRYETATRSQYSEVSSWNYVSDDGARLVILND